MEQAARTIVLLICTDLTVPDFLIGRAVELSVEGKALCAATDEALEAILPIPKRYRERLQALFPDDVGEEGLEAAIEICGQALEAMTDATFYDEHEVDG